MESRQALAAGSLLAGRYRLAEPLRRAGLAVWLANDEVGDRPVTVEEIEAPADGSPRAAVRRQASAAARLSHHGLTRVLDLVEQDGRPWIVTEFVAAPTLEEVLATIGPLSDRTAASTGLQILEALGAAVAGEVEARDVRPSTVLLADDGQVVLTGVGIPRHRAAPGPGGPVDPYLPPELMRGSRAAGLGSDLWSLGATLYAAVHGRAPDRSAEPPPAAPDPLAAALAGLLDPDPGRRLSADEAGRLLREVLATTPDEPVGEPVGEPVAVRLEPPLPPTPTPAPAPPVGNGPGPVDRRAGTVDQDAAAVARAVHLPPVVTGSAAARPASAGPADTGPADTRPADAGLTAGQADGGAVDGGTTDAGTTDAGTTDAGTTDAGTTDAGTTDAGTTDAGTTDAGTTDAGTTDAGTTDADTSPVDPDVHAEVAAALAALDAALDGIGVNVSAAPRPPAVAGEAVAPTEAGSTAAVPPQERPGSTADQDRSGAAPAGPSQRDGGPGPGQSGAGTPAQDQSGAGTPAQDQSDAATSEQDQSSGTPGQPDAGGAGSERRPAGTDAAIASVLTGRTGARQQRPDRPVPPPPPAPAPAPQPASKPRWFRRGPFAAGIALIVVAVVGGLLAVLGNRDDSGTPTPTANAGRTEPAASGNGRVPPEVPTPSPPAADPVPAGWRLHRDPAGFSVGVPGDWQQGRDGTAVTFRDPRTDRLIRIEAGAGTDADPYDQLIARQPAVDARTPGYDLIRIARVMYRGWPTADWEYRTGQPSALSHVLIRSVVPDGTRSYMIYWSTSDSRWAADRKYFDTVVGTFSPAP